MTMAFYKNDRKVNALELYRNPYLEQAKEIDAEVDRMHITGESREAVIKVRVNQGVFRDLLLNCY